MLRYLSIKLHSNFTIIMTALMLSIIILFYQLSSYIVQDSIKNIEKDLNHKLNYIENDIDEKFTDTKHIIFNLSNSLSKEFIYSNNNVVEELFSHFDDRAGYNASIPFSPVNFINKNMEYISGEGFKNGYSKNLPKLKFPEYFKEIINKPFELYIGKIIYGSFVKKLVMPLGISITGDDNQLIGILWTGIFIDKLNEQLTLRYAHNKYLGDIHLKNNKEQDTENSYTFNKVEDILLFDSILEIFSQHRSVFIHKELKNYPFVVELEVNPEYFKKSLGMIILFCIGTLILFTILIYC